MFTSIDQENYINIQELFIIQYYYSNFDPL